MQTSIISFMQPRAPGGAGGGNPGADANGNDANGQPGAAGAAAPGDDDEEVIVLDHDEEPLQPPILGAAKGSGGSGNGANGQPGAAGGAAPGDDDEEVIVIDDDDYETLLPPSLRAAEGGAAASADANGSGAANGHSSAADGAEPGDDDEEVIVIDDDDYETLLPPSLRAAEGGAASDAPGHFLVHPAKQRNGMRLVPLSRKPFPWASTTPEAFDELRATRENIRAGRMTVAVPRETGGNLDLTALRERWAKQPADLTHRLDQVAAELAEFMTTRPDLALQDSGRVHGVRESGEQLKYSVNKMKYFMRSYHSKELAALAYDMTVFAFDVGRLNYHITSYPVAVLKLLESLTPLESVTVMKEVAKKCAASHKAEKAALRVTRVAGGKFAAALAAQQALAAQALGAEVEPMEVEQTVLEPVQLAAQSMVRVWKAAAAIRAFMDGFAEAGVAELRPGRKHGIHQDLGNPNYRARIFEEKKVHVGQYRLLTDAMVAHDIGVQFNGLLGLNFPASVYAPLYPLLAGTSGDEVVRALVECSHEKAKAQSGAAPAAVEDAEDAAGGSGEAWEWEWAEKDEQHEVMTREELKDLKDPLASAWATFLSGPAGKTPVPDGKLSGVQGLEKRPGKFEARVWLPKAKSAGIYASREMSARARDFAEQAAKLKGVKVKAKTTTILHHPAAHCRPFEPLANDLSMDQVLVVLKAVAKKLLKEEKEDVKWSAHDGSELAVLKQAWEGSAGGDELLVRLDKVLGERTALEAAVLECLSDAAKGPPPKKYTGVKKPEGGSSAHVVHSYVARETRYIGSYHSKQEGACAWDISALASKGPKKAGLNYPAGDYSHLQALMRPLGILDIVDVLVEASTKRESYCARKKQRVE